MIITEKIKQGFVFSDGGFGTMLQARGLKGGELPETYNITHPGIVTAIHSEYLAAGAEIITANTFGANRLKYPLSKTERQPYALEDVISAGLSCAKKAAAEITDRDVFVALDIGPTGKLLEPLGTLAFEDAVSIFADTVKLGAKHGADFVLIETMNDTMELKAAVLAAKENCDLPVFATVVFDGNARLMTGADPASVVALLEGLRVDALGLNCSLGPDKMIPIAKELASRASVPVCVSPNAGLPKVVDGNTVYDVGPAEFAASMREIALAGARMLGGCCGTTPAHIKAMIEAVSDLDPLPLTEKNISTVSSYRHTVDIGGRPVLIGERLNPTGKPKLKEALREEDITYILDEAISQEELGAHVLDINVGLPGINETEMMRLVVTEVQAVTHLPLQIDTSDASAMEAALRVYNGKALINSVNGKKESMEKIFPLAAKYGGVVVGLTLDENGIPDTVQGRVAIAKKIYETAEKYGIKKKDILIDPLAMAASADPHAAEITLGTLQAIRDEFSGNTSLGVSNISFGLPQRDYINAAFFAQALSCGLSAAIMNPASFEMKKTYYAHCALKGLDPGCLSYIDFAANAQPAAIPAAAAQTAVPQNTVSYAGSTGSEDSAVKKAIMSGQKEKAAAEAEALLNTGIPPLSFIDSQIIPALNEAGSAFEEKRIFLPQLLMCAEAAKAAFDVIKNTIVSSSSEGKDAAQNARTVVIATVKGDIHDIGKNIVKVLLENYGFHVVDLGKDAAPEAVVAAAREHHARLVGLSALMTTTVPSMEETIKQIHAQLPDCKVVVGGAVLTQEYADMIGADQYSKTAMDTVRYAETILGK